MSALWFMLTISPLGDPTTTCEWVFGDKPATLRRLLGGRMGLGHNGAEADR